MSATPRSHGRSRWWIGFLTAGAVLLSASGSACGSGEGETGDATGEPGASSVDAERPNVVFVLLDDVRADDIRRPFLQLPNIERLRSQGAEFRSAFTVAPLCSPSRAAMLTGQYPHNNTIVDNRERNRASHRLVTFPRLLHEAGYRTGFVGKWHMGHRDATRRPGFDRWVSFEGQGEYFDPRLNVNGERTRGEGYITDILNRYAARFVERAAGDEDPFLLFVAHKAVHPEIHPDRYRTFPPAPRHEELYRDADLYLSPAASAGSDGKPALARSIEYDDPRSPPGGTPDSVIMNRLRMLSAVDEGIGDLLATLESAGELDETVFVLTSDQGFFYGEFGLAQERRLAYEPSIRIPLVVRYPPAVEPGSRPDPIALNIDLAPTVLEMAGVEVPSWMEGRSLGPLLRGREPEDWRDAFLVEYYTDQVFPRIRNMGYRAIRTERHKYVRYEELEGMNELYDLSDDPHELDNLLASGDGTAPGTEDRRRAERLETRLDSLLAASRRLPAARTDSLDR